MHLSVKTKHKNKLKITVAGSEVGSVAGLSWNMSRILGEGKTISWERSDHWPLLLRCWALDQTSGGSPSLVRPLWPCLRSSSWESQLSWLLHGSPRTRWAQPHLLECLATNLALLWALFSQPSSFLIRRTRRTMVSLVTICLSCSSESPSSPQCFSSQLSLVKYFLCESFNFFGDSFDISTSNNSSTSLTARNNWKNVEVWLVAPALTKLC